MVHIPAVLVVDDEEICLTLTEKLLEKLGVRVLLARDGVEAVELFQVNSEDIAFVLMDIQMPRMDGIEAFRVLKKLKPDVQVIFVSGYVNNLKRQQIEPMGPAGFIKKPPTVGELEEFLHQSTGREER